MLAMQTNKCHKYAVKKELKVRAFNEKDEWEDSPESLIIPYEDINTKQQKITGERFPNIVLELCDSCRWCVTCFNPRGLIMKCPICSTENSQVPMNIDEVCDMEFSNIRGITLSFDRKNPMR
jgi:hypothetical protein